MDTMYKIFADFNNADKNGRLRLSVMGAQMDIQKQKINLYTGMQVLVYDDEEFEVEGTIEFSNEENIWVANINWDEVG